ncbi:hypothetical protein GCM10010330_62520 [Streptomyces tendae]|nr:hypothetical protein GCM10010330_62520 [Streptomyces tendae]
MFARSGWRVNAAHLFKKPIPRRSEDEHPPARPRPTTPRTALRAPPPNPQRRRRHPALPQNPHRRRRHPHAHRHNHPANSNKSSASCSRPTRRARTPDSTARNSVHPRSRS